MKNELNVTVGEQCFTCILMEGFPSGVFPTARLHRHSYAELHVLRGPKTLLEMDDRLISLEGNCVFALPAGCMHRFRDPHPDVCHSAFLTSFPFEDFCSMSLSEPLLSDFLAETVRAAESGNYAKIAAFISLFFAQLQPALRAEARPVTDLNFLVNNFFNLNYDKEKSLTDLADELHFSEKQTARLVQKYTGQSFKQAMVNYRMSVAKYLEEKTDLPLTQIALLVGYRSYNGFWKAYKAYTEEEK